MKLTNHIYAKKYICFFLLIFLLTISVAHSQNSEAEKVAIEFLNSLDSSQKQKAIIDFEDESRTKWHYFPSTMYSREGISLGEMNNNQKNLLQKLLKTYLNVKGYKKTNDAIEAEGILRDIGDNPAMRSTDLYYVSFYGKPNKIKPWAWSFEGHHLSVNFTINGDDISYVPIFYGAAPVEYKGKRFLSEEEDIALKLVNSFEKKQRIKAVFSDNALNDILSGNKTKVFPLKVEGLSASEMNQDQQRILFRLIREYISSMPEQLANERIKVIKSQELKNIHFAWAGKTELTEPHYYRIQGKSFLIELDNTQNNANHIHSVWRNFDGDFGRDLIKEHYQKADHHN
jgi:hypothetical protein